MLFVLLGFSAYISNPTFVGRLILYGLIFGMCGDVFLNLRYLNEKNGQKIFLIGILFFLIGHILYLVALISQAQYDWLKYCVFLGAMIATALLTYIFKTMEVKKAFKIFGVFYLGAVFIMSAIALGIAIFMPSKKAIIYALGAVLFTASDVVLIFNTFSGVSKFSMRIVNLSLYYLGQILIACSVFF